MSAGQDAAKGLGLTIRAVLTLALAALAIGFMAKAVWILFKAGWGAL